MAQEGQWEDHQSSSIWRSPDPQSTLGPEQDDLLHILLLVWLHALQLGLTHAGGERLLLVGLVQVVGWPPKEEEGPLKAAGWPRHLGQAI